MNTIEEAILYGKDRGNYESNMGLRIADLSKIQVKIEDMQYNHQLLLNTADFSRLPQLLGLQERLQAQSEVLQDIALQLKDITALMLSDTNTAKSETRQFIKSLERAKTP